MLHHSHMKNISPGSPEMKALLKQRLVEAGLEEYSNMLNAAVEVSPTGAIRVKEAALNSIKEASLSAFMNVIKIIDGCNSICNASSQIVKRPPSSAAKRVIVCVRKRKCLKGRDIVQVVGDEIALENRRLTYDLQSAVDCHRFCFDFAFGETVENEEIFATCIRPLVDHAVGGGCSSLLAYGQTGTGKTHTMLHKHTGLLFEAISHIIKLGCRGRISFFEIYQGRVGDCLRSGAAIRLFECGGAIYLSEITQRAFATQEEVERILMTGLDQREVGKTQANRESSRSHAVVMIEIGEYSVPYEIAVNKRIPNSSAVVFVDLAGSERGADRKNTSAVRVSEGSEINKSLLVLKECIRGIGKGQRFLPFRQSKLTQVLKNFLVGNCRMAVFATISSVAIDIEHTLNTLRYASMLKRPGEMNDWESAHLDTMEAGRIIEDEDQTHAKLEDAAQIEAEVPEECPENTKNGQRPEQCAILKEPGIADAKPAFISTPLMEGLSAVSNCKRGTCGMELEVLTISETCIQSSVESAKPELNLSQSPMISDSPTEEASSEFETQDRCLLDDEKWNEFKEDLSAPAHSENTAPKAAAYSPFSLVNLSDALSSCEALSLARKPGFSTIAFKTARISKFFETFIADIHKAKSLNTLKAVYLKCLEIEDILGNEERNEEHVI